jgi:PAS domain S-box-containing protein
LKQELGPESLSAEVGLADRETLSTDQAKHRRKIFAGFALALLALLTVGAAGFYSIGQFIYWNGWVEHTHLVIETLGHASVSLEEIEDAEEGYVLSGNDDFRRRALAERSVLIQEIVETRFLTADNPRQQQLLKKLEGAVNARLSLLDRATALRQTQQVEAAASLIQSDKRQLNGQVRRLIIEMSRQEKALLEQRNRESNDAGSLTRHIILFGSAVAFLCVGFTAVFINRTLEVLRGRTDDLARSYQNLLSLSKTLRERGLELASSEQTLRNQSELLRSVLDSMDEGIIARDLETRPFLFNPMAARILDRKDFDAEFADIANTEEFFLNDYDGTAIPLKDLPLSRALQGEEVNNRRLLLRKVLTGEEIWLEISARPLKSADGTVIGGLTVFRDIRQRKRAEREQAWLAAIVECSPDAIMSGAPDGKVTTWNPGAEKLYGYAANEIIGKSSSILVPSAKSAEWREILSRMAKGEAIQQYETRRLRKDGTLVDVSLTLSPLRNGPDHSEGISLIARDITESKRITRELEQRTKELERSNAELEQFAYSASHDLQEPLRMVASYVQLLQRRYKGKLDSDADDFIAYAVDGATRMKRLINDLLTYSRAGRGKPPKPVKVTSALDWALSNLSLAIEESSATVTRDAMPIVMSDESQLGELFQNLIGNAIKFRGAEPLKIHVGAKREGNEWLFTVRDNGIGIEPQYFSRIFLMFQRLHGRQEYPGTGIGLAICRRIVEHQAGRIWVESTPGDGTIFFFTIPIVDSDGAVETTEREDPRWEAGKLAT